LVCSSCGRRVSEIVEVYEREVRDLSCFEYQTTVVLELYRVRCPQCGVKTEKVEQLPSKAVVRHIVCKGKKKERAAENS
jgi:transposase